MYLKENAIKEKISNKNWLVNKKAKQMMNENESSISLAFIFGSFERKKKTNTSSFIPLFNYFFLLLFVFQVY